MKILSIDDIDESIRGAVHKQQYAHNSIDGVKLFELTTYPTEDGSFTEIIRIQDETHMTELVPDFRIAQINTSIMLPQSVKAWHLHFNQDELWSVTGNSHLLLGLWDIRAASPTKGMSLKIPLTRDRLVYIPRGVAHGAANISGQRAEILYFVSSLYNRDQPDEQRLAWDSLGANFWEAKKE